jgi:hypothetical protein
MTRSVRKFNLARTLAIRTRADEDDYVRWDNEFEDSFCCASSWFCIELILHQNRNETKSDHESENENEIEIEDEDDENESKQYSNRLSLDTKTNDAKSKDDVNRLHFMRLKSWEKKLFFRKEKFFFFRDANSISDVACLDSIHRCQCNRVLSDSINRCQCNRRMMSR